VSTIASRLAGLVVLGAVTILLGWPLAATVIEASQAPRRLERVLASLGFHDWASMIRQTWNLEPEPASGNVLDPIGTAQVLGDTAGLARPVRLAVETLILVLMTLGLVLPSGVMLALLLFRTDIWGRQVLITTLGVAAFVPLPLHATAWLGALGNAGRMQAIGVRPILVGRTGAAVIHALAALPWVVLLAGVGFRTIEPELEESAVLEMPEWQVWLRVTLRRGIGAIAAAAMAVAVLTSGDMTVTDLLQVRTYAEEAYVQFTLGQGPGAAAAVSLPPLLVLGVSILLFARALVRADPARLATAFSRARVWRLGRGRVAAGAGLILLIGNVIALPIYSLLWRAGRVGGRAGLGQSPKWSLSGLTGTLRYAASECWEPIQTSLILAAVAATMTAMLAWALAWRGRRNVVWQILLLVIVALTLATPGPVAGMALGLAYRWFPAIYDSPAMVVMAQSVRTLPYALLILWPVLRTLPRELLESAALDGLGPGDVVWRLAMPLSSRGLLAAWFVAFVLGFGELPATNLVQPPGTTTITFLIWTLLHTGVESHLAGVALIMLAVIAVSAWCGVSGLELLWKLNRTDVAS
jgi:iron(III) transport system permease protein